MVTKIKGTSGYSGGKEGQISALAVFFLVIGIVGLIACLILAGLDTRPSPILIVIGIVCLIQGIAFFIFLSTGAEIVRLLKKQNGLNYGGEITEPSVVISFKCSKCGTAVSEYKDVCPNCDSKFEPNNKSTVQPLDPD